MKIIIKAKYPCGLESEASLSMSLISAFLGKLRHDIKPEVCPLHGKECYSITIRGIIDLTKAVEK